MPCNTHYVVKPGDLNQYNLIEFTRIDASKSQNTFSTSTEILPFESASETLRTALQSGIYQLESTDMNKIVVALTLGDSVISRLVFSGGDRIQSLVKMLELEGFTDNLEE